MSTRTSNSTDSNGRSTMAPKARSRLTNRPGLLADVDGRTRWPKRNRDLVVAYISDMGGIDMISEKEKTMVECSAVMVTELQRMVAGWHAAGTGAPLAELETYQRTSNTLRRLFMALGLQRRSRDVTPSIEQYLAYKARKKVDDDASP